ncbi:aspartic proteinase [Musa troglodytarum]|nr:aspartic proteinase [Musa troglodytarum]
MARGPLSPVSQLGEERFSYCFASDDTTTALLVGSSANPSPQAASTPFVSSHSPLYYLSLQGISVGATLLPIPTTTLVLKPNGTGGLTGLPVVAVSAYDLCVSLAPDQRGVAVPSLAFHFDGGGYGLRGGELLACGSERRLDVLGNLEASVQLLHLGQLSTAEHARRL